MKTKNINKKMLVVVGVAICVITVLTLIIINMRKYLAVDDISSLLTGNSYENVDPSKYPYTKDVKYTAPVKYMDLFNYAFQKTDIYKKNKDFPENARTDKAADAARQFIEAAYSIDYRTLMDNTEEYQKKLTAFTNPDAMFYCDAGPIISENDGMENFVEAVATYYVENELTTQAHLVTDPELVYWDGYFYCRGVIEIEEFGDNASEELKCYPVEIALTQHFGENMPFIAGIEPVMDQYAGTVYEDFTNKKANNG